MMVAKSDCNVSPETQVTPRDDIDQIAADVGNPSLLYVAMRTRNFYHSSRLDGIDMSKAIEADSLHEILEIYRKRR